MFTKEQVAEFKEKFKCYKILDRKVRMILADGKIYALPVALVALDILTYYSEEDGVSLEESFKVCVTTFEDDWYICDWVSNNMVYSECKDHLVEMGAVFITEDDMEDSFVNSKKEIF